MYAYLIVTDVQRRWIKLRSGTTRLKLASLSKKKRAYNKYISTHNQADKLEFVRIRRETKKLIKRSKKNLEEYRAEASKFNHKEFYSYVNNKKSLTFSIGPLAKEHGNHTNDENEMATIVNNFFASVFTDENCLSFPPLEVRRTDKILDGIVIVESFAHSRKH